MAINERMTIKELVDKHYSYKEKINEIMYAIRQMQDDKYHTTEVIERAKKDQRYAVQFLLNEYKRLKLGMEDLEKAVVRFVND